jgi:hypothetical protein
MTRPRTVARAIAEGTAAYAALPVFRAFREDRIPVDRFPAFLREQYLASRWFQDLIWATTEVHEGPFAAFAQEHRRKDSGHHRWARRDLAAFGLAPMTDDDWFAFETLPTRLQMARILARCHEATPAERMVILAALESAGSATLGTLHDYVVRHGFEARAIYLGAHHVALEAGQSAEVAELAAEVMSSTDPHLVAVVELVFDALGRMFDDGSRRHYGDLLEGSAA